MSSVPQTLVVYVFMHSFRCFIYCSIARSFRSRLEGAFNVSKIDKQKILQYPKVIRMLFLKSAY